MEIENKTGDSDESDQGKPSNIPNVSIGIILWTRALHGLNCA